MFSPWIVFSQMGEFVVDILALWIHVGRRCFLWSLCPAMNESRTSSQVESRIGFPGRKEWRYFAIPSSCFAFPFSRPLFWIGAASLAMLFAGLDSFGFIECEAMYAEVAREMRMVGDFITPHLNGTRHFDKPAFFYWLIVLSQSLLGETEFAARMWPVLATWGTVLVVAGIGRSLYGPRASRLGALVFATCMGPHIFGRMAIPDAVLCFWIALAVLGYVRGYLQQDGSSRWRWWMFAGLGFATLTKGILGLGLGSTIIGLHLLLSGGLNRFFSRHLVPGILLTLAIAAPWYVALGSRNPDFWEYFIVREHLLRLTGERYPRDECLSLPVFLAVTYVWTFPWLALVPQAIVRGFKRLCPDGFRKAPDLLPLLWIGVVLGLFTAAQSRLEYYALPAMPAFALLTGKLLDDLRTEPCSSPSVRAAAGALAILTFALALAAVAAMIILGPERDLVFRAVRESYPDAGWVEGTVQMSILDQIRFPTIAAMLGSAVCAGLATTAIFRRKIHWSYLMLSGMMIPFFFLVHWGFQVMQPFNSSKDIAEVIRRAAGPEHTVVFQEPHEYMWVGGITYYTKRLVHILKDPRYDMASARRREPPERFLDTDQFLALWTSERPVLLVSDETRRDLYPLLSSVGPVHPVDKIGNLAVFSNVPVTSRTDPDPDPAPSLWSSPPKEW